MDTPRQLLAVSITLDLADNAIVVDHSGMPSTLALWLLGESYRYVEDMGDDAAVSLIRTSGPITHVDPVTDDGDDD